MDQDLHPRLGNTDYEALIKHSFAQTRYCICSKCDQQRDGIKGFYFSDLSDCFGKQDMQQHKDTDPENIDIFFRDYVEESFLHQEQGREQGSMQLLEIAGDHAQNLSKMEYDSMCQLQEQPQVMQEECIISSLKQESIQLSPPIIEDLAPKIAKKPRRSANNNAVVTKRIKKNQVNQAIQLPFSSQEEQQPMYKVATKKNTHTSTNAKNNHHTKNIPKIYGNAFRTYILQTEQAAEQQCQLHGIELNTFLDFVKAKNFYSIKSMRESFACDEQTTNPMQAALVAVYRLMVFKFLREEAVTWFLQNKRIGDNKRFCSFRAIIARGIKDPKNFISWDD